MHEAQVRGICWGAYLHCTATTPFETVCKQFINGSVPFGYSLNSGFDTGNDSWFSSGAWQVTHLFRKCLQVQVLCGWERAQGDPRGLGYHFLVGLALCEEKKKIPLHSAKKAEEESVHDQRSIFVGRALSTCTLNINQELHERVEERVISIPVMSKLPH